ncbi:hypothetical protein DPMN_014517 [Dreissena polymorpha]|uniref:Uncharacterized protein n=1 Tax=Dreissena polymorpha TaxID=45954 RepID=A0A9D4N9B8_DREPO|nr:hypothetical protein DPMN_014517 [Dreissena polymorpha]
MAVEEEESEDNEDEQVESSNVSPRRSVSEDALPEDGVATTPEDEKDADETQQEYPDSLHDTSTRGETDEQRARESPIPRPRAQPQEQQVLVPTPRRSSRSRKQPAKYDDFHMFSMTSEQRQNAVSEILTPRTIESLDHTSLQKVYVLNFHDNLYNESYLQLYCMHEFEW